MTSVKVMTGEAVQLSVPVAVPVLPGKVLDVHSIVTFAGQVMVGATVSSTTMVCVQVEKFPQ